MSFRSIFYLSTFIVDKHLLGESQSSLNLCTYVPSPLKAYKMPMNNLNLTCKEQHLSKKRLEKVDVDVQLGAAQYISLNLDVNHSQI